MTSEIAHRILDIPLEEELSESYGRYAKYVILDRALPDVRDGLKPVQRRIIYSKFEGRNLPDRSYRKCAKSVGDVMGNYHPHGDQSIYGALVRLAQPWKMRQPLVDGHGNFGSIDDDPPAAMRYTESRMAKLAMELVRDIDKETVDFQPTFDDKALEPSVLPARFPNLLVNGCSGVSTGFATEIPPHNLGEVIDGVVALIEEPDLDAEGLMKYIPGPDFPTGGVIMGRDGIKDAYRTGSGRINIRAKVELEKETSRMRRYVVTELPYGVVKSSLVKELDELRLDDPVSGLLDARDESDREGLRVVIELSPKVPAEQLLAYLYSKTSLEKRFSANMVAIDKLRPKRMNLWAILSAYLDHQREVVRRRSKFDLDQARERLHKVEGFIRAFDLLDDVIAVIRLSQNKADAKARLIKRFEFSPMQTEAILQLRLHRLTNLQIVELKEEHEELVKKIADLEGMLADEWRVLSCIREELLEIKERYATERRTEIKDEAPQVSVRVQVVVEEKPRHLLITRGGFLRVKEKPFDSEELLELTEEGQVPELVLDANTTQNAMFLSSTGQCYYLPLHTLEETRRRGPGMALVNLIPLEDGERIVRLTAVSGSQAELEEEGYLLQITSSGRVKRTELLEFDTNRTTGIIAMRLGKEDQLITARCCGEKGEVLLLTESGRSIRFPLEDVSVQKRHARGVKGMSLKKGEAVVSGLLLPPGEDENEVELLVLTSEGAAKRSTLDEYRSQGRGGRGVRSLKQRKRNPHRVVAAALIGPEDDSIWLAFSSTGACHQLEIGDVRCTRRDGTPYSTLSLVPGEEITHLLRLAAD